MARIQVIAPSAATGRLRDAYGGIAIPQRRALPIPVPNIMRIFSLRPEYLETGSRAFHTMWGGTLPRTVKDMIAVAVSQATRCHY